jgi:hypothetical protein
MTGPLATSTQRTVEDGAQGGVALVFLTYRPGTDDIGISSSAEESTHTIVRLPDGDLGVQEHQPGLSGVARLMDIGGIAAPLTIPDLVDALEAAPPALALATQEGNEATAVVAIGTAEGTPLPALSATADRPWLSASVAGATVTIAARGAALGALAGTVTIAGAGILPVAIPVALAVAIPTLGAVAFGRTTEAWYIQAVITAPTFARASTATYTEQV